MTALFFNVLPSASLSRASIGGYSPASPPQPSPYIRNGDRATVKTHRDREKRLEIEKRCKDRKADALQLLKNELVHGRGLNMDGSANTLANLLFRAADAMR